MERSKNYYAILHVTEDADEQVIVAAYRALAKKYHPDIAGSSASEQMKLLNEAFAVLRDTGLRKEYDRTRDRSEDLRSEQGSRQDQTQDDERDWHIAARLYPEIIQAREELENISSALGNTFKFQLLETKKFAQYEAISLMIRRNFLSRYFGKDRRLQSLGQNMIIERRKNDAKKLNEMVSVFGDKLSDEDVERIMAQFPDIVPSSTTPKSEKKSSDSLSFFKNWIKHHDVDTKDVIVFSIPVILIIYSLFL